jgi:integrin-linked kinase
MLQMFCFHVILFFLSQIDEDLTARINMADAKFSFQEKGRIYYPAWMSPEGKEKT